MTSTPIGKSSCAFSMPHTAAPKPPSPHPHSLTTVSAHAGHASATPFVKPMMKRFTGATSSGATVMTPTFLFVETPATRPAIQPARKPDCASSKMIPSRLPLGHVWKSTSTAANLVSVTHDAALCVAESCRKPTPITMSESTAAYSISQK